MALTKMRLATLDEADWSKCPLGPEQCPSSTGQGALGRKLPFVRMVHLGFARLRRRMAKSLRQFVPPALVHRMNLSSEQKLVSDSMLGPRRLAASAQGVLPGELT